MKKTSFSFRAVRSGSRLHRFFLGKNGRCGVRNAAIGVAASILSIIAANAQCNTFYNADEANPLNGLVPAGKYPSGFAFADIDADGDLDLYMFYYKDVNVHFFRNTGTPAHPVYKEEFPSAFPSVAGLTLRFDTPMQFVDIDADGDYDFFITDANAYWDTDAHIHFYKNTGTRTAPHFEEDAANNPVRFAKSSIAVPFRFADVDGDGDYDFSYINSDQYGNPDVQYSYTNIGTAKKAAYKLYSYSNKNPNNNLRTYYDWSKDGRLDYFLFDPYTDSISYYRDTATGKKPAYIKDNANAPVFRNGFPDIFTDLNNDGAPEIFTSDGHYSTLSPVAVIKDSILKNGNTSLYSKYTASSYTYRWELNGKTVSSATGYSIVPKQSGTYTLYVTDGCGTGVSLNYVFTKTSSIAAERNTATAGNLQTDVSAKAYPNPFAESFTLQLPGTACTVKITDMAGRVLLTQTTSATALQMGRSLAKGNYFIQVWQAGKIMYKTTIVKL